MAITVLCPKCSVRLTLGDDHAGGTVECPRCDAALTIPVVLPAPTPPPYPKPSPPPKPAPLPLPLPDDDPEHDDPEDDDTDDDLDDYEPSYLRKRRRQRRLVVVWRSITLAALGVSLLCFFLPWVRYEIIIPKNAYIRQDRIEFGSQSGIQVCFALVSTHPALDRWIQAEAKVTEAEWRRQGKNPFNEWLKENKPYMAIWLLLYPLALGVAGMIAIVSRPTPGVCMTVGGLAVAVLLLLLLQFGVSHPPAVNAFYDQVVREGGGPDRAILLSLLLDVRYTVWFNLAVAGIVLATLAQGVPLVVKQAGRWSK